MAVIGAWRFFYESNLVVQALIVINVMGGIYFLCYLLFGEDKAHEMLNNAAWMFIWFW